MKKLTTAGAALLLSTTAVHALGLDRSGQPIGAIFEDGSYAELTFGKVMPKLDGADLPGFGGSSIGNVANDYSQFGFAYKADLSDTLSYAIIGDQPYGVDIAYPATADGGGLTLAGTSAQLESKALTVMLRYKIDDNFSVHGGIRSQTIEGDITLAGAAYGGLNGYTTSLGEHTNVGYAIGAAYERKDIALRVALTYHSSIKHEFETTEFGGPSTPTSVETPQAVNLDFQTGIAADTLLFGSIRWAEYSTVIVSPATFAANTGGNSLTDIDDGFAYNIGVGRRFSDQLSGSVSFGYEATGDDLVSPLSPSNGNYSVALGAEYKVNDNVAISGGVRYIKVGDAQPQTNDTARASFTGNDAIGVGMKIAYSY